MKVINCKGQMNLVRSNYAEIASMFQTIFDDAANVDPSDPSGASCAAFKDLLGTSYYNISARMGIIDPAIEILNNIGAGIGCTDIVSEKDARSLTEYTRQHVDAITANMPIVRERKAQCGIESQVTEAPVVKPVTIGLTTRSPARGYQGEMNMNENKCKIETIEKQVELMDNGWADARHYFSIGDDRFKIDSEFAYSGSGVSGFTLDKWDGGWSEVKFFPSVEVKTKFSTTKNATKTLEPAMKKIESFALKFAGCD